MASESPAPITSSPPRGIKRKADDIEPPRRIRALHEDVVNKIAAGEIIVAPVHALKELIENAVDAGSTSLEIMVKDGGLKLLQITDNGSGIQKDDLPILCERFTTSKLKAFEDLQAIGTYGFRGEALASISHIAHLSITTKTADSSCAWKAHYAGGKLAPPKAGQSADPKACAGRQGTQIQVEDLFYNVPTRRRAFRSASEEYTKIAEVVGKYAVHCKGVAFSCKKHGEAGAGIMVPVGAGVRDRIRMVHSSAVANELIDLDVNNTQYGFRCDGLVSNANYSGKRTTLLLFINHRAVESSAIKKAVEQTYAMFLPKGGKPFLYLSLEINPARVDVNVHPTKREVNFLNEEEIIELICDDIRERLGKVDTSRTFLTQSLLPGGKTPTIFKGPSQADETTTASKGTSQRPHNTNGGSQKPYENNLVRTDARSRKITSMLPPSLQQRDSSSGQVPASDNFEYEYTNREPTICRLTTIKELRSAVRESMHNELTDVFANHTFIGVADEQKRIAAIQGGVKLFLVDYGMVCAEYFYQLGLTDFGNFGSIRFDPPLDLKELLEIGVAQTKALEGDQEGFDWEIVAPTVADQLIERREMLAEYFSFELTETGELMSLPLLMKGYMPSLAKLPNFLLRLGPHVDWNDEKGCFQSFLRELASFYVPEVLPPSPSRSSKDDMAIDEGDEGRQETQKRREELVRAVENVIFPALKSRLVATRSLLKGVMEVANLKGLYRVFERC
ncbi:DNA mismatch repair protein MutL [Hortaea werneckii]|uniref:DNA mismatch repair protein S5 domain-containing protein n=1 Tax=Hortaea werneckii TaxID=91943 RepID=A0A3M7IEE1_HORWE|nr:DNA mismatch repair protein MutL [Hortaea werneckii]KAI6846850.1 DNA mismatch repair protein MutL [Hortaea werneckii]KAI6939981.1 DNA mismatch repair protein MutL [Hortaea werneckii]KAI6941319.1 DNA mismatch repair protein MutL [Hortaea werneckii]KAI6974431.1 DNA mismatch repair protein MutL [Hortaea werneckii]